MRTFGAQTFAQRDSFTMCRFPSHCCLVKAYGKLIMRELEIFFKWAKPGHFLVYFRSFFTTQGQI